MSDVATKTTVYGASGLILAATALVGTVAFATMTQQWGVAKELGTLSQKVEQIAKIDAKLDSLIKVAEGLQRQITAQNLDPTAVLASAGLPIDRDVQFTSVGGDVIALPKTPAAEKRLKDQGLQRTQFTPSFGGYPVDPTTAAAIETAIRNKIATTGADLNGSTSTWSGPGELNATGSLPQ